MMTYQVCPLSALGDSVADTFDVGGRRLAVARIGQRVFALDDRCSHSEASLGEGEVDGYECTIECNRHGALFSLESGEALTLPATRPVNRYEARIEGGAVVVELP